MTTWFIHLADPTYQQADSDFPFGRRLGPFLTEREARAQAVSDLAGGQVRQEDMLGVFSESASETHRSGLPVQLQQSIEAAEAALASSSGDWSAEAKAAMKERLQSERPRLEAALARLKPPKLTVDDLAGDVEKERLARDAWREAALRAELGAPPEEVAVAWEALLSSIQDPELKAQAEWLRSRL